MVEERQVTLFIVDDEDHAQDLFQNFFEKRNYRVLVAKNVKEALVVVRDHKPDITILDMRLGNSSYVDGVEIPDGLQVLEEIKKNNPLAKVLVCTGLVDDKLQKHAEKLGADGYVNKPFQFETLFATVEEFSSIFRKNHVAE